AIKGLWDKSKPQFAKKPKPKPQSANDSEQQRQLIQEINEAKKEWQIAQTRLDYVADQDQIDYVIYALEAAEERYEMLLRTAKKTGLSLRDGETGHIMEG